MRAGSSRFPIADSIVSGTMTGLHVERSLIGYAVVGLGMSAVMTQLALLREMLAAFSGNEMVLSLVLGWWCLLMGLGASMGRRSDRLGDPYAALILVQFLVAVLPLAQVFCLRALRNVIFIRGAEIGVTQTALSALVLLSPYCLTGGFGLTLACLLMPGKTDAGVCPDSDSGRRPIVSTQDQRSNAQDSRPRIQGSIDPAWVYIADSVGSALGGLLFCFIMVRFCDHLAILILPAIVNLLLAGVLAFRLRKMALLVADFILLVAISAAAFGFDLDGLSTALQFSKQSVVARANSPYGKIIVTESDGQFDFIENGVPLTSTRDDQRVEETVHFAMAQRPDARNVLLVSGGFSGTAREILKYNVPGVDYVELDPLVPELANKYLPGAMADPRVHLIHADGRQFIKRGDSRYDVVIVDMAEPSTAQFNRYFTVEFFAQVKSALSANGVLSFALGQYENYVSPSLARLLSSARASLTPSFRNVLLIPGGRVYFLASDGPLSDAIAASIERRHIATKLVNRHYSDAMLTPDRMSQVAHGAMQSAEPNRDFSPVLYYYHLRHWMSQFAGGFRVLPVALLALVGIYVARLRGPSVVLFASGFAGSALEIVLLLAFQVLSGAVYQQISLVVTMFMSGLALGAWFSNRPAPCRPASLRFLALVLAAFAITLPCILPLLNHMGASGLSSLAVKGAIAALTLILAFLVGMQFPLANRLQPGGTAAVSRLYAADFVGACLGAFLTGALLIPLTGVTGACLVTAALNLLGAVAIPNRMS